jgi:hypothetical protein
LANRLANVVPYSSGVRIWKPKFNKPISGDCIGDLSFSNIHNLQMGPCRGVEIKEPERLALEVAYRISAGRVNISV